MIISDNGPQYGCQSYKEFSEEWGFQHIPPSPRYNGFIERQVETVKHTLEKAKKSGKDLPVSILCLRSTPIDSQLPSPAELLYQRKRKSNLPVRIRNQMSNRDQITQRLTERQENMNTTMTEMHMILQDQSTKRCVPGTVKCKRQEPRSCEVQIESGATFLRNRRHFAQQAHSKSKWVPEMRTQIPDLRNILLMFSPMFRNRQNHHIPLSCPAL